MAKSRKRPDETPSSSESLSATATATPEQPQAMDQSSPDPEHISRRAYELYLARGGSDGQDWEDWLEAERQLRSSGESRGGGGE